MRDAKINYFRNYTHYKRIKSGFFTIITLNRGFQAPSNAFKTYY